MQLHRYIPNKKLPKALKRPLVFGDRQQIDALNSLEININQDATNKAKISSGPIKIFNVSINYGGTVDIEVLAVDAIDAKEKAEKEFDIFEVDTDILDVFAREIKNTQKEESCANLRRIS